MRKFVSLAIAFVFFFTLVMPSTLAQAQADTKISLKEAIEIAKSKLGITDSGYDFSSSYNEYDKNKSWTLYWNSNTKGNISVSIDADTGEITYYYMWIPTSEPYQPRIPKYTRDEARKVAIEFLQRIAPEKFKQAKETDTPYAYQYDYYDSNYNFSFQRIVDGIPFPSSSLYVSVDKNTLKVTSYSQSWYNYPVPKPEGIISQEEAMKIFKEKIGLTLQYNLIPPQSEKDTPKVILVYNIYRNAPIDAFTGEIKKFGSYYYPMNGGMGTQGKYGREYPSLSPEEQKEVEATEKYISKDKAIEIVKNSLPFSLDDYKLTSANLYANYYYPVRSNPTWNFSWNLTKDNKYYYVSASVDAVTGEFINFYRSDPDVEKMEGKEPKYTEKEMKKIVEDYLKKIIPDKFKNTISQETAVPEPSMPYNYYYNFVYTQSVNGILAPFNSISVSVNSYTGEIISYNLFWADAKFPPAENIINLDDAYKILFDNAKMELMYVLDYDYKSPETPPKVKLVYQLNFYNYIDAKTGQIIDSMGKPVAKEEKTIFTDIEGNWAEKDIKLLAEYGIIDVKEDKYYPDKEILQKDFIKMLIKAIQPPYYYPMPKSSEDFDTYYNVAISKKIISEKEKNPDSIVTREQAAKMLVKSLGVGYIADIPGIFTINFKDKDKISQDMVGYVAIISGLKIMNGSDGYFEPQQPLTRAQAATVIIRFLQLNR